MWAKAEKRASRTTGLCSFRNASTRAGTLSGRSAAARAADQRSSSVPRASAAKTAAGSGAAGVVLEASDGGLRINGIWSQFLQTSSDRMNRLRPIGTTGGHELARHAPDDGGVFGLCNSRTAGFMQASHGCCAVVAHAGHQHADQLLG